MMFFFSAFTVSIEIIEFIVLKDGTLSLINFVYICKKN